MVDPLLLGIDVGTGSTKGVLADTHGRFFATAASSYTYKRSSSGYAEQNPQDWWKAVCQVTQLLLAKNPGARERIACVGVSGQGVAAILVGRNGEPLRDAMLWLDTRCAEQARALCEAHGEELTAISGKCPAAYNFEPKLLWLREHEPDIWEKTWKALTTTAYINFQLTGRAVMNYSDAGITLSWDLKHNRWSEEATACIDLSRNIYCDVVPCHQVIGTVSAKASRECGLAEGTPVIAGGEDTSSSGLAMGVVSGNEVQLSMGLASTVNVPFPNPVHDSRLLAFPHVLEGTTLMGGSMVAGGLAVDWLEGVLHDGVHRGPGERNAWMRSATAAATNVPAGANGLIFAPYLAGELQPVNDGFARGVLLGMTASTTRAEIFRAVMEGTAFAIQHNLGITREAGANPVRTAAVGGPTRNDLWCQIIADVTGMQLDAMDDNGGAALGDAILAGISAGLLSDPLEMQRTHAKTRKRFTPQQRNHEQYQGLFGIYREIYPRLKDLFPKLASQTPRVGKIIEDVHL